MDRSIGLFLYSFDSCVYIVHSIICRVSSESVGGSIGGCLMEKLPGSITLPHTLLNHICSLSQSHTNSLSRSTAIQSHHEDHQIFKAAPQCSNLFYFFHMQAHRGMLLYNVCIMQCTAHENVPVTAQSIGDGFRPKFKDLVCKNSQLWHQEPL